MTKQAQPSKPHHLVYRQLDAVKKRHFVALALARRGYRVGAADVNGHLLPLVVQKVSR